MDSKLPSWTKYAVAAAVVAIAFVVVRNLNAEAEEAAWAVVGEESVLQGDVEAMEAAREQVKGTPAATLLSLMLSQRLYELGGAENFERARQVASEALDAEPDHLLAANLRRVIAAVDSFEVAPSADA